MSWLWTTQEGAGVLILLMGLGVFVIGELILRYVNKKGSKRDE